ncbi:MAG TPA: orotidine-5'-phosphate decarboxylase [Saprospiraceae bacterium]|nr:orotidine-5'-phosphate decarboxylase [Saprospiraceae bacterium]
MTREELVQQIRLKHSFLCVGLDPDPAKLPIALRNDPVGVVSFCDAIIKATSPYSVAYKLNTAFFEALGRKGWDIIYETRALLPKDCFLIADAKRADIGNSSKFYARAFFEELDFDAVTVAPYMGEDSVRPFLEYKDKWTILLALTSNEGAENFQMSRDEHGTLLFERVLTMAASWGTPENLMFVAGATQKKHLQRVREIVPAHFLLIPGVGAQGGSLEDVTLTCLTDDIGILVNSTREIIYASDGNDFAQKAAERAHSYQKSMQSLLGNEYF